MEETRPAYDYTELRTPVPETGDSSSVDFSVRPIDISLVLPVYDEVENIRGSYDGFRQVLDSLRLRWEMIFVNDGSQDGSRDVLEEIAHTDHRVRVVNHRRNFGKSAAQASGFSFAKGIWVATADADLQQDPADLAVLMYKAQEGYELVNGTMVFRDDPLSKRLPSRLFNAFTGRILGTDIRDLNSAVKVFRHDIAKEFIKYGYGEFHRYFTAIAVLNGYSVGEVRIEGKPRVAGKSKFGIERYMRGFLDFLNIMFFHGYMERPLHFFGGMAITTWVASFLMVLYMASGWITGGASLFSTPLSGVAALFFIAGIQLFGIGLIGSMVRNLSGGDNINSRIASLVGIDRRRNVDWRSARTDNGLGRQYDPGAVAFNDPKNAPQSGSTWRATR